MLDGQSGRGGAWQRTGGGRCGSAPGLLRGHDIGGKAVQAMKASGWLILIIAGLVALMFVLVAGFALAHDHSRPELTPWLKSLHAKDKTWCCDGNDTDAIEDWETKGNRYRVKFRGEWFDVPEGSVVDGPNNGGDALLWMNKGYLGVSVRCFMPGPLT